ncbi:hypothetical protein EV421DRAFT_1742947 [Armillaria borealis]|uniref:F-box domain-containing protein n=1 Tax=Armillaria borealis TaxID=47425 RepID=A0AA39MEU3_9AGAR|nr:hypothetical protein EV421DRAFT_1742947 [Armillaria borealis]
MANVVGYRRLFKYDIRDPSLLKRTVAKKPVATLGRLGILPNELLEIIISECCDIQTIVTSFSLLNRCARKIVDASLAFQRVSRHAPAALVAMLRTQAALFFTLEDLCDALCSSSSCGLCGGFGPLLWLPEYRRCCVPCLYKAPELLPISKSAATEAFGISKSVLASVPTVCSVPGQYGHPREYYQDIRYLLSFARARAAAVEDAGGETQFMVRINSVPRRRAAYKSFIISQTRQRDPENVARCMVAVPLPYFNRRLGKTDKGRSCAGCEELIREDRLWQPNIEVDDDDDFRRYDTVHTIEGLIRHVWTDCPEGKRIWKRHLKKSKQGKGKLVLRKEWD